MEMNKHDGEDFEKANLLLAKFYIDKVGVDLHYSYILTNILSITRQKMI